MTVEDMEARMSYDEWANWKVVYKREAQREELAWKKAKTGK